MRALWGKTDRKRRIRGPSSLIRSVGRYGEEIAHCAIGGELNKDSRAAHADILHSGYGYIQVKTSGNMDRPRVLVDSHEHWLERGEGIGRWYAFVKYINSRWDRGRMVRTLMRNSSTGGRLQKFFVSQLQGIYLVPIEVVESMRCSLEGSDSIQRRRRNGENCHLPVFAVHWRTLSRLARDPEFFEKLGFETGRFEASLRRVPVDWRGYQFEISLVEVKENAFTEITSPCDDIPF